MLNIFFELNALGEIVHIAVDAHACVSALTRALKDLFVHSLLRIDNRGKHEKARPLGKRQDFIDNLIKCLLIDFLMTNRTMRHADTGVKKS